MAQRNLRNIRVVTPPRAEHFTSHIRAFIPPIPPTPSDPVAHAGHLTAQIQAAAAMAATERNAAGFQIAGAKDGFYVEFVPPPGFDLKLESLENKRANIELMNVRETASGDQRATVFVPDGSLQHFIDRFSEYAMTPLPGDNRKHRALVDSVSALCLAKLQSIWTDDPSQYPHESDAIWWEVWLSVRDGKELARFQEFAKHYRITIVQDHLRFVDRIVVLAHATPAQLSQSVVILGDLAELRRAKDTPAAFVAMTPVEQAEWVKEYQTRIQPPAANAPAVCVLDTGIAPKHPLLELALANKDCHACNAAWKVIDHDGHGTEMAGLALHGNLTAALNSTGETVLQHRLESVKILPPTGNNDPRLYGAITALATSLPEIADPNRKRVFSLAVTSDAIPEGGLPSSWSAALDALAMGRAVTENDIGIEYVDDAPDGAQRLFVVSAGNVRATQWPADYIDLCDDQEIESPAQAWNVLTVGGYTDLATINPHDKNWEGWSPMAAGGELSPFSRTSVPFDTQWPLKPEVVFEAGNAIRSSSGAGVTNHDDLSLLTTYFQPRIQLLTTTNATSAATAQVSRIAAQIMAAEPDLWPETIRALIVHSARWTARMKERFATTNKTGKLELLRRYGFGVPDAARAIHSARNAVNLVYQGKINPYNKGAMQDMHLHELPWPVAVLQSMGATIVRLRITLSYFIEPYPARRGWLRRHRYASHALRFEVKSSTDDLKLFRNRINKAALVDDEERPEPESDEGWILGRNAQKKGSLHSDIWEGPAAVLADRGVIAVVPRSGWWKERKNLDRSSQGVRYALAVSIETDDEKIDLWTPIDQQVAVQSAAVVTT